MSMSMSCGQRLSLRVEQRMALTQEQRLVMENHLFVLRLELVGALRKERYEPKAQCPKCGRALKPIEILNGFNQDPNDFSTHCPGCGERFNPTIISYGQASSVELPFFCACQVLNQLSGKELVTPNEMSKHYPAVYRSALIHFGTVSNAFKRLGKEYPFSEVDSWKKKAEPFLGRLSDKVIAECVGVSAKTIAAMRNKVSIKPFQWRKALAEAKRAPQ